MTRIFVYGTLRQGFGNYERFLTDSKFVGNAQTVNNYTMFKSGIPFVNPNIASYPIVGEVYDVTDEVLARLDRLEGHPDWYYRKVIPVVILDTAEETRAAIYFNNYQEKQMLAVGDFKTNEYVNVRQNKEQTSDAQSTAQE